MWNLAREHGREDGGESSTSVCVSSCPLLYRYSRGRAELVSRDAACECSAGRASRQVVMCATDLRPPMGADRPLLRPRLSPPARASNVFSISSVTLCTQKHASSAWARGRCGAKEALSELPLRRSRFNLCAYAARHPTPSADLPRRQGSLHYYVSPTSRLSTLCARIHGENSVMFSSA
ncbi:hypothetical protein FA95DRAFT_1395615 [Auriscalpium vulgare]|uniref:Uncharacterized protein n=1 Tax=Auriscalpium vulgare TaxID=40419 RepID=A0ACB8RR16_9AGAM|nr:hypothetical protein FA95DRAFT_1395615 [Auriscalpium vulgare]